MQALCRTFFEWHKMVDFIYRVEKDLIKR